MLTAVITGAAVIAAVLVALGYVVGRTRTVRESDGYLSGQANGYRRGIQRGENARAGLRRQVDTLTAALARETEAPIGDDTLTMLGGEPTDPDTAYEPADVTHHDYWAGGAR